MTAKGRPSGRTARGRKPGAGPPPVFEWDRRAAESPEAYACFLVYRDMGPARSLARVRQRWTEGGPKYRPHAPSLSQLKEWSARWAWSFRVDAWDAHVQRLRDEEIRRVFTQQIENYRILSDSALVAASKGLELVLGALTKERAEPPSFSAAIAAAASVVELNQRVASMAFERLERMQAAGAPSIGAREELLRRLRDRGAARERASRALEEAQAPAAAVQALREGTDGGTPAPQAS